MLIEYHIPEGLIGFGLDQNKERECLLAIEYWKDAQMNNFEARNKDWIRYCHKQIEHIQEFMHRNG